MAPSQVQLSITTESVQTSNPQNPATPPKITMNGNAFPQPTSGGPGYASGVQVVVLDPAMDITSPSSIRANQYVMLYNQGGSWMESYPWMWGNVVTTILTAGNTSQQIVFVVTFGLDANIPPTTDALELFLELGAGPQLQKWETTVDKGSQGGGWVGFPANYVLVGQPEYGYGEGTEEYSPPTSNPVTTTVQTTLTNFGG